MHHGGVYIFFKIILFSELYYIYGMNVKKNVFELCASVNTGSVARFVYCVPLICPFVVFVCHVAFSCSFAMSIRYLRLLRPLACSLARSLAMFVGYVRWLCSLAMPVCFVRFLCYACLLFNLLCPLHIPIGHAPSAMLVLFALPANALFPQYLVPKTQATETFRNKPGDRAKGNLAASTMD